MMDCGESYQALWGNLPSSSSAIGPPRAAGGDEASETSSRPDRSARLRAAFDMVLERQGVTLPAVRDDEQADSFQDLAEACDLRIREVRLSGRWWLEDGAPLAAWLQGPESAHGRTKPVPVALLPPRAGTFLRSVRRGVSRFRTTRQPDGYRIWDAETGERPVDEDIASRLDGTAWQLYASLPPEPLSLSRLFATRNGRDGTEEGAIRSLLLRGEGLFVTLLELLMAALALVPPAIIGAVAGDVIPRGNRERLLQFMLLLAAVGVSTDCCASPGSCRSPASRRACRIASWRESGIASSDFRSPSSHASRRAIS